jgi:transglutaminase-like putative cysteine protease
VSTTSIAVTHRQPVRERPARRAKAPVLTQLVAFAGLALYCAEDYARLETDPPQLRVLGVVAIAALGGAALGLSSTIPSPRRAKAARILAVAAMLLVALSMAGLPVRLLWPAGWAELVRWLGNGFAGLAGDLWPYRGSDHQVRLVVLLAIPVLVVPAAALAFWPGPRRATARRRTAALALLIGLYITAVVNQEPGAWGLRGLALFGLLAAWLWLDRLGRLQTGRAVAWLSVFALGALVLAALLPAPVPWLAYRNWDPFGSGLTPTSFQWNQRYGPISWPRSRATMLEVAAPEAQLWKVTTLDRFDGVGFLRSDDPPPAPLGPIRGGVASFEQLRITVRGLRSRLLVGAGQILSAGISASQVGGRAELAPDGSAVASRAALQPGDTYTVLSFVPHATVEQLRRAPAAVPAAFQPFVDFQLPRVATPRPMDVTAAARLGAGAAQSVGPVPSWRAPLPAALRRRIDSSPYTRMFALARRLAAGHTRAYDVAAGIAGYLRRNYLYSERPPSRPYPLEAFLFQDGVGYCQQFSAAMTLMLRMDGIPARVAEGFLPGTYDRGQHAYRVTARDAHAWVEVYFPNIGWWSFDPTPPRRATLVPAPGVRLPVSASLDALTARAANLGFPSHARDVAARPRRVHAAAGHGWPPVDALGLGLLGTITVVGATLLGVGTLRLRRGPRGEADDAVAELTRALERLGHHAPADLTLTRLARRLGATHGGPAARYVERLAQRRFDPASAAPAPTAADRRALRRALVSHGGARQRLRGLLALPPAVAFPRLRARPPR